MAAVRIGVETRSRGNSYRNSDYDTSTDDRNDYVSERTRFYLEADMPQDITVGMRLQSRGIWGKTVGDSLTTALGNIPFRNFTPQVENAYIQFNNLTRSEKFPVIFTIGRQPIRIGDGYIVDDNDLGFNAARLKISILPEKKIFNMMWDGYYAKMREANGTVKGPDYDTDLIGTDLLWAWKRYKFMPFYIVETEKFADGSGSSLKKFYGLRAESRIWKIFQAKGEFIKSGGQQRDALKAITARYKALSWVLEMHISGNTKKYGFMDVRFVWGRGGGDAGGNLGFSPSYARRHDGTERAGWGEYFSTNLYEGLTPLKTGVSGISTVGFGAYAAPGKGLFGEFNYWVYRGVNSPAIALKKIGEELNVSAGYQFFKDIKVRAGWASFFAGSALELPATAIKPSNARKIFWEFTAAF